MAPSKGSMSASVTHRVSTPGTWPVYAGAIESVVGQRLKASEAAGLAQTLGKLIEPLANRAGPR